MSKNQRVSQQAAALSPEDEQKRLLQNARVTVQEYSLRMKRELDQNKILPAINFASTMLRELRTNLLWPKNYYDLYLDVVNHLSHLAVHLQGEADEGMRVCELYELVQYVGEIIPRLYLMITVGSVFIKSRQAPAADILFDMSDMCMGLQHPTRGLFVRNYLTLMTREKLPDVGNVYLVGKSTVGTSLSFILGNFTEMNRLWVRMQHQGHTANKKRLAQERSQLKMVVGTNLFRISQLEGIDASFYAKNVFPALMTQVVSCKDDLAQQYLMDILTQVFPDSFHLATLKPYLKSCSHLQSGVDVKAIIISLMERIAGYAQEAEDGIPEEFEVFSTFDAAIKSLVSERREMPTAGVLELQCALARLSVSVYPDRRNYLEQVLSSALEVLKSGVEANGGSPDYKALQQLSALLQIPMDLYPSILDTITLPDFPSLLEFLPQDQRKSIAESVIDATVEKGDRIGVTEIHGVDAETQVEIVLRVLGSLLRDEPASPLVTADPQEPKTSGADAEDFAQEQASLALFIHSIGCEKEAPDSLFAHMLAVREAAKTGGDARAAILLMPVCFRMLKLLRVYQASRMATEGKEAKGNYKRVRKTLQFLYETLDTLAEVAPLNAVLLYLSAAKEADAAWMRDIAYELLTRAFEVYEDDIAEIADQRLVMAVVTNTLRTLCHIGAGNYQALSTLAAQYSKRLLKKPDKCVAISNCAHLFVPVAAAEDDLEPPFTPAAEEDDENAANPEADDALVLECLKKALKIASKVMGAQAAPLFVHLLNQYLFFAVSGNPHATSDVISELTSLAVAKVDELGDAASESRARLDDSIAYIRSKVADGTLEEMELP